MGILMKTGRRISFSRFVPYRYFHKNRFIISDLDGYDYASFVFHLQPINYKMYSEDKIKEVKVKLMNFLNALDQGLYCQFIWKKHQYVDDILEKHISLNKTDKQIVKNLTMNRVQKNIYDVKTKRLFEISLYVVITKRVNVASNMPILSSFSKNQKITEQRLEEVYKELDELEELYKLILERTGLKAKTPSTQEVIDLCASQINATEIRNIKADSKESIILSDVKNSEDHFVVYGKDRKYLRAVSFKMSNFPEAVYPTIISYISDLPFTYDIIVNIQKLNKSTEVQKLKIARNTNRSMRYGFNNVESPEKKQYEENAIALIESMMSNKENLFKFELTVIVKEDSLELLKKAVNKVMSAMSDMEGAIGYAETHANFRLFYSSFPGCGRFENFRNKKLYTSYISDLLPVFGPPQSVSEPVLLLRNEYNTITYFNPLSSHFKNRNGIIFASSGAGKSFTLNYLIMNTLAEDPIIIIIDVGGSYKKQVESLGGKYFRISDEYTINPFQVDTQGTDITVAQYWSNIIEVMIREQDRPLSNDEKAIIEDAVHNIIKKNTTPTIGDFVEAIGELRYDDDTVTATKERIKRHLNRWTKGIKGKILNNRTSDFNPDSDFLCIDFKGLKQYEDILEVFLLYVTNLSWQKMALEKGRKKLIVFDEAWDFMSKEQGAILMEELYRTARKENGAVISISQSLNDFTKSKSTDAIMANLGFYYILQLGEEDPKELQHIFNLTDKQIDCVKELHMVKGQYSKVFIKTPDTTFIGKLVPAPLEYWYATTDADDQELLVKEKEKNPDLEDHLLLLEMAKKYPAGAHRKVV